MTSTHPETSPSPFDHSAEALTESLIEVRSGPMSQPEHASTSNLASSNCPLCHRPLSDGHREDRHAALQRDDALLKTVWNKEMGEAGERSVYRKVSVLLISWDDEAGDLETEQEVLKLQDVLQNKYNFEVLDRRLDGTKPAQIQLNEHLANFVTTRFHEDGLLIVYYAGHGIPGEIPGVLKLAGSRNPDDHDSERKNKLNQIIWHQAENLIKVSLGDVLVIFDCCAAGNLGREIGARGSLAHRAFEFLGATTAADYTPEPGPNSFTSGLIWALEKLVSEDGFTTSELLRNITQAPEFPKEQYPVLYERDKPTLKKIVIAPLLKDGSFQKAKPAVDSNAPPESVGFLDLRVLLSRRPTEDDITNIAQTLKRMINTKELSPAQHISWLNLSAIEVSTMRFSTLVQGVAAIKKWNKNRRNKSSSENNLDVSEELNGYASSRTPTGVSEVPPRRTRKRRRQQ